MTGPGTRWRIPGGREAIEVSGSTRDYLRLCVIPPGNWPWPNPPQDVVRSLCQRLPSRYHGEPASVERDGEELL